VRGGRPASRWGGRRRRLRPEGLSCEVEGGPRVVGRSMGDGGGIRREEPSVSAG
jgi:hypothetical protein